MIEKVCKSKTFCYEDAVNLTQFIEEILTVIKYTLRMDFTENDIYFQRFITHLKFFSQRVLMNQTEIDEANQVENDLFSLVTKTISGSF